MSFKINNFTKTLTQKLNAFDRQGVTNHCDKFITYLYNASDEVPAKECEEILFALRNKRMFELMQKIGDVLIQTGHSTYRIRKQYAQSLIDQNNFTAALAVLNELIEDTNKVMKESKVAAVENFEAKGLKGRIYNQLYVNSYDSSNPQCAEFLRKSINSYFDVYKYSPKEIWHGVNVTALVLRGKRDNENIDLSEFGDPLKIAADILKEIDERVSDENVKADRWDYATAVEACIALNKPDEALIWLGKYLNSPGTDAFELASTLRQFTEVWQLNMDSGIGIQILPLLRAKLLRSEGGEVTVDVKELQQQKLNADANNLKYEKVFGKKSYKTYKWYMTGADRCLAIARIGEDTTIGYGTGFLMEGKDFHESLKDELVLLTNAHVISDDPNERDVLRSHDAVVIFEALNEAKGKKEEFKVSEIIWSSPKEKLDATLLRFKPGDLRRLKKFTETLNFFPIAERLPIVEDNQRIYIIGHPAGGTLQLSFADNLLLDHKDPVIHYRTPTFRGSSGSPVFNEKWDLIGLHHAGSNSMKKLHGEGTYEANEGIWIKKVMEGVRKSLG